MRVMNKTGLSIDPWVTSPVIGLQVDCVITFWAQLFVLSSSPYFMRIIRNTVSKVLLQFWYTVSTALPSATRPVISSQKFISFSLVNPCWLFLMTFQSFRHLEMVSRISCSVIFLGGQAKPYQPAILWVLLPQVRSDVCFPPVYRHFQLLWSIKE